VGARSVTAPPSVAQLGPRRGQISRCYNGPCSCLRSSMGRTAFAVSGERGTNGGAAPEAGRATKMKNITRASYVILAAIGAACSSASGPTSSTSSASKASACSIPPGANTDGDGSTGCRAQPDEQNCTVTNGASVFQDGAVENGTKTCTSPCPAGQFYLECDGPPVGTAPSPDPSLNCTGTDGLPPSYEADYCCPCGP
jgi:hypothetical protein